MYKKVIFCLCLLSSGCINLSNDTNLISHVWIYTHSKEVSPAQKLTPVSFINLQQDNTYTSYLDSFDYGKWKLDGKKLILTNSKNNSSNFTVNYVDGKNMQLSRNGNPWDNFTAQAGVFKTDDENPWSLLNNRWRIPATQKEDNNALLKRLINHSRFWEKYFTWANDNRIDYIDVRSTPTPFMIYGNAFTIKAPQDLPKEWKSFFFDDEDCINAEIILTESVQNNHIALPGTENRYLLFISAFQQMQQVLMKPEKSN